MNPENSSTSKPPLAPPCQGENVASSPDKGRPGGVREFILGGVRSGKSRMAEQHAQASGLQVVYVATAEARDEEMQRRVAEHRSRRPDNWQLAEAGHKLAEVLQREANAERCLLVDC